LVKSRLLHFSFRVDFHILVAMRHNDANCNRDHRWITGQTARMTPRVAVRVGVGQGMPSDLLSKEAYSTV